MEFLQKYKSYIGIVIVAVVGFWVYLTFFASSSSATLTSDKTSPLSQDVLATLSSLHVIQLDQSIFGDPLFTSLSDYSVSIPSQTAGRRNPFAPI